MYTYIQYFRFTPITTVFSPLKEQKTLPPETFPGLKISPKCICSRSNSTPDPPGEQTVLLTIQLDQGKEGGEKREEGKEGEGRIGEEKRREEKNPETKRLAIRPNCLMSRCNRFRLHRLCRCHRFTIKRYKPKKLLKICRKS